MEWNSGMEGWNGIVEYWNGGMTMPTKRDDHYLLRTFFAERNCRGITRNDSAKEKNMG